METLIKRRKTRSVKIGGVGIGSNYPVSIQSMTKTDTCDAPATLRQIKELKQSGCQIVRIAIKDFDAAKSFAAIKSKSVLPIEVDIHFNYKLALEAVKAGADAVRLNPGNISKPDEVEQVAKSAKENSIPIRIGLNSGSLPGNKFSMVSDAINYIKLLEKFNFYDIMVSLKASDVFDTVAVYRNIARRCDYPLHLGVTATGTALSGGIVKSSIGIGALLLEGIGDTIRVSLSGDPVEEVKTAKQILSALNLRRFGPEIIACPTCGRTEVDLLKIVNELEDKLAACPDKINNRPLKIALMGCIVNGPGEVKGVDIGIAAGKGSAVLFKKGQIIRRIKEKDIVKALIEEIRK